MVFLHVEQDPYPDTASHRVLKRLSNVLAAEVGCRNVDRLFCLVDRLDDLPATNSGQLGRAAKDLFSLSILLNHVG